MLKLKLIGDHIGIIYVIFYIAIFLSLLGVELGTSSKLLPNPLLPLSQASRAIYVMFDLRFFSLLLDVCDAVGVMTGNISYYFFEFIVVYV